MHAPATPGDSVPGDAAGDDSGQGSGSSVQEQEQVQLTLLKNKDFGDEPTGSGMYPKGTTVAIEAPEELTDTSGPLPYSTYHFYQWSDGNSERTREIVLESELTLTAMYQ